MPQETLGNIELEWTCRNCGTRNKGSVQVCQKCGAPMAADQEFELPAQQELQQPVETSAADAPPDIHCPYCGTRNPGTATICKRCGGDLTQGKARERGKVLGAYQPGQAPNITCPYCGTENPATALQCQKCGGSLAQPKAPSPPPPERKRGFPAWIALAAVLVVLGACAFLALALLRTDNVTAQVQEVSWNRAIAIQALQPVKREAWRDSVPGGARLGVCEKRFRREQDEPAPVATKVCGTPYVIDQGTGQGKVVQDCTYRVYEDWCQYEVNDWVVVRTERLERSDLQPAWPAISLRGQEREGQRQEQYTIVFDNDGTRYTYHPGTADEFMRYQIGSAWTLKVNKLGGITSVSPAR